MLLLKLAWRNLWRNKRRTLLNASAIAVSTVLLTFHLSLQKGAYTTLIENFVRVQTGHIQIMTEDYLESPQLEFLLKNPDSIEKMFKKIKGIRGIVKRLKVPVLISGEKNSTGALLVGTEPEREKSFSTIYKVIIKGDFLSKDDPSGIIIGKTLADNLNADVGSEIVVIGQGAYGSLSYDLFKVRGIFRTGVSELDRLSVYVNLKKAQEVFSTGRGVSYIALLLNSFHYASSVRDKINFLLRKKGQKEIQAHTWDEIMPGVKQAIILDASSGYIFFLVLLFIVSAGVLNTFLMSVLERMRELGIMRAIGIKPLQMAFIIFYEAFFLGVVGYLIGIIVGVPLTLTFEKIGISFGEKASRIMEQWGFPSRLYPDINIYIPVIVFFVMVIIISLSAIYPVIKASKTKEISALRYV